MASNRRRAGSCSHASSVSVQVPIAIPSHMCDKAVKRLQVLQVLPYLTVRTGKIEEPTLYSKFRGPIDERSGSDMTANAQLVFVLVSCVRNHSAVVLKWFKDVIGALAARRRAGDRPCQDRRRGGWHGGCRCVPHLRLSSRRVLPLPVGDLLPAPGHDALSVADSRCSGSFFDVMVPVIVGRLAVLEQTLQLA